MGRYRRALDKTLGMDATGSDAIFQRNKDIRKMTENILKRFFAATRRYFSRFQPKSANLGFPLKLAGPEGSGFTSSESLPAPIRRRRFDSMRRLGLVARKLATLLKFVGERR